MKATVVKIHENKQKIRESHAVSNIITGYLGEFLLRHRAAL